MTKKLLIYDKTMTLNFVLYIVEWFLFKWTSKGGTLMYQDLLAEAIRESIISMRGDIKPHTKNSAYTKKEEE